MGTVKHALGGLCAGLAALHLAAYASASDSSRAQKLFDEAQKLRAASRYSEACPKLEESQRLDPAIGTLLYLADCYEQTGRLGKAWRTFDRAEREAQESGQEARAEAARDAKNAIAPRVGLVRVEATGDRGQVTVWFDGDRLGGEEWVEPVRAEPGEHTVEAGAAAPTWAKKVKIAEPGATQHVQLPDFGTGPVPDEPSDKPGDGGGLGAQEIGAVTAAAVGVVALGIGIALGVNAKSVYDDSEEYCAGDVCQPEGIELRDSAFGQATGADVCFVLSGVALAAGLVLWLTAPSEESVDDGEASPAEPAPEEEAEPEVSAQLGPAGGWLTVRW